MNKKNYKKIVVPSRGMIHTSRGTCRGPIERPYYETIDTILSMISRQELEVYEVLSDNVKVRLTLKNFDKDNSNKEEQNKVVPGSTQKTEVKSPSQKTPETDNTPDATAKNLSRKDRKRLEYEQKKAERAEESKKATNADNGTATPSVKDNSDTTNTTNETTETTSLDTNTDVADAVE